MNFESFVLSDIQKFILDFLDKSAYAERETIYGAAFTKKKCNDYLPLDIALQSLEKHCLIGKNPLDQYYTTEFGHEYQRFLQDRKQRERLAHQRAITAGIISGIISGVVSSLIINCIL